MSIRWSIESHEVVTSTMDLARARARAGAGSGLVVVAAEQTSGRGRRGSHWESPLGGLWFSVVVRPERAFGGGRTVAPELTVAAALAASAACGTVSDLDVRVKWPNDLYVADAKVGGVMGETIGDAVLLGIGINANVTEEFVPSVEYYRVTSLCIEAGLTVDVRRLLDEVLSELEQRLAAVADRGVGELVGEWRERSLELGRRVVVVRGEERFRGRAEAIRDDGALVVNTGDGTVVLMPHGDVSLGLLPRDAVEGEDSA